MTKNLWMRLILPLVVVFVFSIYLNNVLGADGFFINLATEIVGIVITVAYVDWILQRHEKQKWLGTDERVANRLMSLLISTLTTIRTGLGFGAEILDDSVLASNDSNEIHKEVTRLVEQIISPVIFQRIDALDPKGWKDLTNNVAVIQNHLLTFLSLFQTRLSPDQISDLLDLQDALSNSRTFYTIFPDIAGIAAKDLPMTRTPPEILQKRGYEETAKELKKALELVAKLSRSVTHK